MFKKVYSFFVLPTTEDLYQLTDGQIDDIRKKINFEKDRTINVVNNNQKCKKLNFCFQSEYANELSKRLKEECASEHIYFMYTESDVKGMVRSVYGEDFTTIVLRDVDEENSYSIYFISNDVMMSFLDFRVWDKYKSFEKSKRDEVKSEVIKMISKKVKKEDIEIILSKKYNKTLKLKYLINFIVIVIK